jgi:hypothetical protein
MKEFSLGVLVTAVTRVILATEDELHNFYHHMLGDDADMSKHKLLYETVKCKIITTYPEFEFLKVDRPINSKEDAYRYKKSYVIEPL